MNTTTNNMKAIEIYRWNLVSETGREMTVMAAESDISELAWEMASDRNWASVEWSRLERIR